MRSENVIFAQYNPAADEGYNLYTVPTGCGATGTLWIAGLTWWDTVSVQIIPATILGNPAPPPGAQSFILNTDLKGQVPIYLQQLHMNDGDVVRIYSKYGTSAFTFTGELLTY